MLANSHSPGVVPVYRPACPFPEQVTTCCFDKTGTLTSDHMVLEGVAGAEGQEGALVADVKTLPTATSRVLACCQSLLQVGLMGAEGELPAAACRPGG
jgi:P-type E1-E2 ATPase